MPNVSKYLEDYSDYKNMITADNGAIYGFARLTASADDIYTASDYIY